MNVMTEREYLVSKGLAKPSRGRFSREAKAELESARKAGMTFKEKEVKEPKPRTVKVEAPKRTESVNPAAVREWAIKEGKEVSSRGRLPESLIVEYLNSTPKEERKAPETEGGIHDYRPAYRRYEEDTTFSGEDSEGKTHTVNSRQACSCGYSLSGHICETPSALVNTSNGLERIRVYPDGRKNDG